MNEKKQTEEKPKEEQELIFFEVDVHHPCWACDLTERNKDATINTTPISIKQDRIVNMVDLKSSKLKEDIEFLKKHKLIKEVEVLMLQPERALLKITAVYHAMTFKALHETNVALIESPITQNSVDSEVLLAKSFKDMTELINLWKEQTDYDVRLKSKKNMKAKDVESLNVFRASGFFDLKSAKELLTEKQLEIFRMACDYGYYETPKKISIEQLAERTGISPPTLAEHLRKAEAKLMPIFMKVLRKI